MRKLMERLRQFERKVAAKWPGIKTKLSLVLAGVAPVAALAGYQVDPDAVTALIEDLGAKLMAVEAALIGLALWFRRLTDVYRQMVGEDTPQREAGSRPPGESG